MATEAETIRKEIRATVVSKAEMRTKPTEDFPDGKPYWKLELQDFDEQYTRKWGLFDFAKGQNLQIRKHYVFKVYQPPNPKGGHYNNIDDVGDEMTPPVTDGPEPASGDGEVAKPPDRLGTAWEDTPMKPDHPSKRRSIERQKALDLAVHAVDRNVPGSAGEDAWWDWVQMAAERFYEWISEAPPQPQSPPAPTTDTAPGSNAPPTSAGPAQRTESNGDRPAIIEPQSLPDPVSELLFGEQCAARGWTRDIVMHLLGGKSAKAWVNGAGDRNYRAALLLCIEESRKPEQQREFEAI